MYPHKKCPFLLIFFHCPFNSLSCPKKACGRFLGDLGMCPGKAFGISLGGLWYLFVTHIARPITTSQGRFWDVSLIKTKTKT